MGSDAPSGLSGPVRGAVAETPLSIRLIRCRPATGIPAGTPLASPPPRDPTPVSRRIRASEAPPLSTAPRSALPRSTGSPLSPPSSLSVPEACVLSCYRDCEKAPGSARIVGMAGPRVVNLVRPYRSEQEYLEHEAWTIERHTITLVGAPPLDVGEQIRFSIVLPSGQRVVRAEGQVLGPRESSKGRPAGVSVRFRRFDLATKKLVERLEAERGSSEAESSPTSIGADIPPSIVVSPPSSEVHPIETGRSHGRRFDQRVNPDSLQQGAAPAAASRAEPPAKSAPRASVPPEMRDALLERLRERVRK